MSSKFDSDFARVKIEKAPQEPDITQSAEHKQWLGILGKADLPARLHRDLPDIEKPLEKAGLAYSTKELASLSPLAKPPAKQDVVLFTRKGRVVGYAVGATPLNT